MNRLDVVLVEPRFDFRPGEKIEGVVSWHLPEPPRRVELNLFWYTRCERESEAEGDLGVVDSAVFDSPEASDHRDFELTVPEGPYSFTGELVSLAWALELIVEPGGWSRRVELVVSSTGRPVTLGGDPASAGGAGAEGATPLDPR